MGGGGESFKYEFAQAPALKINFMTSQGANEKALKDLTKANSSATGLKQALQAWAVLYGELLETSWFVKNFDLSARAKSLKNADSQDRH